MLPEAVAADKPLGREKVESLLPGFYIIKDKLIKPLLVATEKVVETLLPESESMAARVPSAVSTTQAETLSLASAETESFKLGKRLKRLTLDDEPSSCAEESADDVHSINGKGRAKLFKKRRFKQLERQSPQALSTS